MYQHELEKDFLNFLTNEGASPKTLKNYAADLRDFFEFLATIKTSEALNKRDFVMKITESDVLGYLSFLEKSQKSQSTITRRTSTLRTFFRSLEETKIITTSPLRPTQAAMKKNDDVHPLIKLWLSHDQKAVQSTRDIQHVDEFLQWINGNGKSVH